MTLRERKAMELALEVMRSCGDVSVDEWIATEKAIEEVLAQPDPYAKGYADAMGWKTANHLEHLPAAQPERVWVEGYGENASGYVNSQPEPVARLRVFADDFAPAGKRADVVTYSESKKLPLGLHDLYTAPPQRTWVGLTDEDLAVCGDEDDVMLARYWERVCKEKNT